ncbi:MAG: hypothetical protein ABIY55_12440, partial [Kofleriaceae bacterium]
MTGCSGTQTRAVGCSKDTDCKDPRVCERGVCVEPARATSDAGIEAIDAAGAASAAVAGAPPFAMFGGDARHTGRRGGPAPRAQPAELWSAAVGGVVAGS